VPAEAGGGGKTGFFAESFSDKNEKKTPGKSVGRGEKNFTWAGVFGKGAGFEQGKKPPFGQRN